METTVYIPGKISAKAEAVLRKSVNKAYILGNVGEKAEAELRKADKS